MSHIPIAAGGNTLHMSDEERLLEEMPLQPGMRMIDLAGGYGPYSLAMLPALGDDGLIYCIDLYEEAIEKLSAYCQENEITGIRPIVADASKPLPVKPGSIDVCFVAAALHDLHREGVSSEAIDTMRQALKPGGILAVHEFSLKEGNRGPDRKIRLSPEALDEMVLPHGFELQRVVDINDNFYLALYEKA